MAGDASVLRPEFGAQYLEKVWLEPSGLAASLKPPRFSITDSQGNQAEALMPEGGGYYPVPAPVKVRPGEEAVYGFTYGYLGLYQVQGMRVQLLLRQNEEFLGLKANEAFIYETQQIGFEKAAYPYLSVSGGEIRIWGEAEAEAVLRHFLAGSGMETELTTSVGRRVAGPGLIAYRPFKKKVRHPMTEGSIRAFVREIEGFLRDAGAGREEGRYYVRISLKQYQEMAGGDEDGVVLLELPGAVFRV